MNTKSLYIKPSIEIIKIESEEVIATSATITEEVINGETRSRKRFWGTDSGE